MRLDYRWQATIVAVLGLFMVFLDNTIVSVALPQMQQAFHTNVDTITWVATGYFLAQAAVIPVTGYLSDRIGIKRLYLLALALFTLGSALCVVAPSEQLLIAFRVIQGIGGGTLYPLVFTLIYRLFPPTERGSVTAITGVAALLAPVLGPTLGGYLITTFDWRAIFTINLPVGVLTFLLALFMLRGHTQEPEAIAGEPSILTKRRFDTIGLVLSMGGFTTLVYGITQAGSRGWSDSTVMTSLILGALVLVTFTVVELRVSDPVIDVRLFANYTFSISNMLTWVTVGGIFGALFLLPFFLEHVQGHSPLSTGEILIGQGVASAVGLALSGRLYNKVGPRILAFTGLIFLAAGTFGLSRLDVSSTGGDLQIWLILRGFGLGLTNAPLQVMALSVVSNKAMARASSLFSVTRLVFSAVGVAGLTTFLTQRTIAHGNDITAMLRMRPFTGIAATCAAIAKTDGSTLQTCLAQHGTVMGLNDTFTLVMISCALCALFALLLGRDPTIEGAKHAWTQEDEVKREQPVLVSK